MFSYQCETIIIDLIYSSFENIFSMESKQDVFKTSKLNCSLESFESIFHAINGKIETLSMDIAFKSKQIAQRFQQVNNQILQESQQLLSDDDQKQQESSQQSGISAKSKYSTCNFLTNLNFKGDATKSCFFMPIKYQPIIIQPVKSSNLSLDYYQKIDINFPESIILKQYYLSQIQSIGKAYQTDIDVIPERIKFMSSLPEAIQDAIDRVEQLRNKIQIHQVQKNAQEIFYSKKYLKKIHPVRMHQIQGRYYLWYEKTQISDEQVKQIKKEVFDNKFHRFYEFSSKRIWNSTKNNDSTMNNYNPFGKKPNKQIQKNLEVNRQKNQYNLMEKLVLNLKKTLFLKFFDQKLKKIFRDESQLQVSSDELALIIHCGTYEQVQMLQTQLDDQYKKYLYFCLEYNANEYVEDQNAQEQSEKKDENISNRNLKGLQPSSQKLKDLLNAFDSNENLCYVSSGADIWIAVKEQYFKEQANLNKFIAELQLIEFCCSILYMHLKQQIPSDDKYISNYCKAYPWLVQVRLKNPNRKNFQQLLRKYIIEGKKDFSNPEGNNANTVSASQKFNQSLNQISVSNAIQDSTLMQLTKNDDSIQQKQNMLDKNILNNGFLNVSKVETFKLIEYKILLKQDDQNFRNHYSQQVSTVEIASSKTNKKFDGKISQHANGIFFKSYALKIPLAFKPANMEEQIVTLFVKQKKIKDKKDLDKQPIKARFIQSSKQLRQNGYLINVPKKLIKEIDKGALQISPNTYQIFKYLKCI